MQEGVAERARHRRVHLGDHERGSARGRQRHADGDAEAQIAAPVGRRAVHQHAVRRPGAARGEVLDEVEIAHRDEFDPPSAPCVVQARRHVPRREAERSVLGPRKRIVAEVDTAQQREVLESLGLPADLGDERPGSPDPGGSRTFIPGRSRATASVSEQRANARAMNRGANIHSIPR